MPDVYLALSSSLICWESRMPLVLLKDVQGLRRILEALRCHRTRLLVSNWFRQTSGVAGALPRIFGRPPRWLACLAFRRPLDLRVAEA